MTADEALSYICTDCGKTVVVHQNMETINKAVLNHSCAEKRLRELSEDFQSEVTSMRLALSELSIQMDLVRERVSNLNRLLRGTDK